ncbi:MAG: glycerol-3-phosphate 1-O-acyltransferase PlsY [Eubacteriales bacterium]
MVLNFLIIFISYFLGNISFSYILTRIKLKQDIREFGSGNAGTTNVLRVLGKKYAVMVLVGDVLKGITAVVLGLIFSTDYLVVTLCGLAVILGHNWPAVMHFKGGKGIATSIGVFMLYDPTIALICISSGIFIIAVSRFVSLGSILGMTMLPFVALFYGRSKEELILSLFVSIITIYKHRSNINRLLKGTENKLKF